MNFRWSTIQYKNDGKVFLLYRQERIFEEGLVQKGMRVLDVGGWGQLATRLLQEGTDCTIFDKFTQNQNYPDRVRSLPYKEGDIENKEDIKDLGLFDLITCFETLEHCKNPKKAIENIVSLLKENGVFVGTWPIAGVSHSAEDPNVQFTTVRKLKSLLSKAGLKDIMVETTPSINKTDTKACSYYFKGKKEQ